MNKFVLYPILLIIYLVLNKAVSPENIGIQYIKTRGDLRKIVKSGPVSAVLLKTMVKGYIIKTYYQKYRVIYGFSEPQEIIVKTQKQFAEQNKEFTGMSLFRLQNNTQTTIPLPPGSLFIGNGQFGRWVFESNVFYWKFYRAYSHFPNLLGWGNFAPNKEFFNNINYAIKQEKPFKGKNNEFGEDGFITAKFIPIINRQKAPVFNRLKYLLNDYLKLNYQY